MTDVTSFWRHKRFSDLCLLKARFTQHRYELHTHPTYVIALITQGCERVRIGRGQVTAPAGSVLVVHPEECHDGEAGAEDGWAYRTLYPTASLMSEVSRELGRSGPPVFGTQLLDDPDLAQALADAHQRAERDDDEEAEGAMLVALRQLIVRHADRDRVAEPIHNSGAKQRFAVYADAIDADREVDLQLLAELTGVTRFQVIRDFKHLTGLTPGAYLRNRRLRLASSLLRQGMPIAEAALTAGFADQSHLTRAYRSTHGITPAMFRRTWSN